MRRYLALLLVVVAFSCERAYDNPVETGPAPPSGNVAPVVVYLSIGSGMVRTGQVRAIEVVAYDPNGDSFSYSYAVRGGSLDKVDDVYEFTAGSAGTNAWVRVTVEDDGELSSERTLHFDIYGDTAPHVVSYWVAPDPLFFGTTATLSFVAEDREEDSFTVQDAWGIGGSAVLTNGNVQILCWKTNGPCDVALLLHDAAGDPHTNYLRVRATNRPPVVVSFSGPASVVQGETNALEFRAYDPDTGDSIVVGIADVSTNPAPGGFTPPASLGDGRYAVDHTAGALSGGLQGVALIVFTATDSLGLSSSRTDRIAVMEQ